MTLHISLQSGKLMAIPVEFALRVALSQTSLFSEPLRLKLERSHKFFGFCVKYSCDLLLLHILATQLKIGIWLETAGFESVL